MSLPSPELREDLEVRKKVLDLRAEVQAGELDVEGAKQKLAAWLKEEKPEALKKAEGPRQGRRQRRNASR